MASAWQKEKPAYQFLQNLLWIKRDLCNDKHFKNSVFSTDEMLSKIKRNSVKGGEVNSALFLIAHLPSPQSLHRPVPSFWENQLINILKKNKKKKMLRECLYCKLNAIYWYKNIQSDGLLRFLFLSTKSGSTHQWPGGECLGGGETGGGGGELLNEGNTAMIRPESFRHQPSPKWDLFNTDKAKYRSPFLQGGNNLALRSFAPDLQSYNKWIWKGRLPNYSPLPRSLQVLKKRKMLLA